MSHFLVPARFVVGAFVALLVLTQAQASDWSFWRGPTGNGVAAPDQHPPTQWSEKKNVVWKTPVPGRGHASPTVHGDRIYLATADEQNQVQGIIAFDRKTGKQVWIQQLSKGGFPKTHRKNTHASGTVVCDGERLFVTFHHDQKLTLHAVDLAGNLLWSEDVGPFNPQVYEYGYAGSPVLYGDTVIVAADVDQGGYLTAFDRTTGKRVWRQDRFPSYSFSSPVIAHVAGQDQLLMSGVERICSYDPATGEPLWSTKGCTLATCGTMVWDGDLVFASGGFPNAETIAVKADGSGEVVWKDNQKCYEQSLLAHDGYLYAFTDQGIVYCWRATDGEVMWRERLTGPVSASPVLVGDTIYATNEKGTTYVFKANPDKFDLVATNKLGDEGFASLSAVDNQIYLRTAEKLRNGRQEFLYCLGEE